MYEAVTTDGFANDFTASVSPVFLYNMGGDILFETELEFGLSGEATTTSLEYAQIDYLGFDRVQFIAGKFLLPFGLFSERLHPTWINKLPTGPVLYGHAHGGVAESGLLPVLADAGAMVRFNVPVSSSSSFVFSGWVSQGPKLAAEDDDHDEEEGLPEGELVPEEGEEHDELAAPPVAFGTSFSDNNRNKMIGGRLGWVSGPNFEIYASGFHARYDDENALPFKGGALSVEWRRGTVELRGEGVVTRQDFDNEGTATTMNRSGVYAQASRRMGDLEPVVRWGWLNDATAANETLIDGHNEVALGLTFWVDQTVPLKVAYEIHQDRDDRMYVQWAYGF